MTKYKVTAISEPKHREIEIRCSKCNAIIHLFINLNIKDGKAECWRCGTKLHWEEE